MDNINGLAPTPPVRGGRAATAANCQECYKTSRPSDLTFFTNRSDLESRLLLRILLAGYVAVSFLWFVLPVATSQLPLLEDSIVLPAGSPRCIPWLPSTTVSLVIADSIGAFYRTFPLQPRSHHLSLRSVPECDSPSSSLASLPVFPTQCPVHSRSAVG